MPITKKQRLNFVFAKRNKAERAIEYGFQVNFALVKTLPPAGEFAIVGESMSHTIADEGASNMPN